MDSAAAEGWADKAKAAGIPIVSDAVWVGSTDEHEVPWVYPSLVALADRDDIRQAYAVGKVAAAEHPDGAKVAVVEDCRASPPSRSATRDLRKRWPTRASGSTSCSASPATGTLNWPAASVRTHCPRIRM